MNTHLLNQLGLALEGVCDATGDETYEEGEALWARAFEALAAWRSARDAAEGEPVSDPYMLALDARRRQLAVTIAAHGAEDIVAKHATWDELIEHVAELREKAEAPGAEDERANVVRYLREFTPAPAYPHGLASDAAMKVVLEDVAARIEYGSHAGRPEPTCPECGQASDDYFQNGLCFDCEFPGPCVVRDGAA